MRHRCAFSADKNILGRSIEKAISILLNGGVCAFPTETGYGLGAVFDKPQALERIYLIKKRPKSKPLLVLVESLEKAPIDFLKLKPIAKRLANRFWPGPITLLVPAAKGLHPLLTGGTGKVGIRVSSSIFSKALLNRISKPITATSANISGFQLPKSAIEVKRQLINPHPDYILDGGIIPKGPASTIVDTTTDPPKIIRHGAIKEEEIKSVL